VEAESSHWGQVQDIHLLGKVVVVEDPGDLAVGVEDQAEASDAVEGLHVGLLGLVGQD
jgi:hypothetical protein